jgi:hypothetical protein
VVAKVIQATCEGGVVTALGVEVPGTTVISEGVGSSQGAAILDEDTSFYIANTAPDLKQTIEDLIDVIADVSTALTQAASGLTAIAGVTGPAWAPPGSLAGNVAQITTKVASLTAISAQLETLKGSLR